MIRPILVLLISPIPPYGVWPKLVSLESYDHGESNAVCCKDFGSELVEDVVLLGNNQGGLDKEY